MRTKCGGVFSDWKKLLPRYTPEELPHREPQLQALRGLFQEFLRRPREAHQMVVQLLGPSGSGKTCTVNRFGRWLQEAAGERGLALRYVHVNCKLEAKSSFTLYKILLERAAPGVRSSGRPPWELLRPLVDHLRAEGVYLLVALDDVDYLIRRQKRVEPEGGVVYDLTRLNEMYHGEGEHVVGAIFIARDTGFRGLLDPSERSSLGSLAVRLDGYDALQIRDILEARAGEAFVCGVVEEGVISYVAELAAADRHRPGDCRYALDLLLAAGLTAEAQGACSVDLEHVRLAVSETYPGVRWEDLQALGANRVAVLKGAVQALIFEGSPHVSLRCVYDFYRALCEEEGLRPLSYTRVRELAGDLHDGGFMDLQGGGGVGVSGVSLSDMTRILQGLEGRENPTNVG